MNPPVLFVLTFFRLEHNGVVSECYMRTLDEEDMLALEVEESWLSKIFIKVCFFGSSRWSSVKVETTIILVLFFIFVALCPKL